MTTIEVHGPGQVPLSFDEDTIAIECESNVGEMVGSIIGKTPMNSLDVLRITSPGIIAILIGLLLPAVQKVREATGQTTDEGALSAINKVRQAAGQKVGSNSKTSVSTNTTEILPYVEQRVKVLRPYFAQGARVELRLERATGKPDVDSLTSFAKALGVPVLIGMTAPNSSDWQGPVTKVRPDGKIERG